MKHKFLPHVRGMRDFLPEHHNAFSYIKKIIRRRCRQFHFQRITTPTVEYAELFERSSGVDTDIVSKELYRFQDKKGRNIALKPEGTAGVVRAYIEHNMETLPKPVKLFYTEPHYRYDRPQRGRYRQFWQAGFESIGAESSAADAEVINLAYKLFCDIGFSDIRIELNSIGCQKCRPKYLSLLHDYYYDKDRYLCDPCSERKEKSPLHLLDCKEEDCKILADKAPQALDHLCKNCESHFELLKKYLKALEIPYVINTQLVRGLDYYNRTVVEFCYGEDSNSLAGGGRYDYLVKELGGPDVAAFGIAFGIDRIIELMEDENIAIENRFQVDIYLVQLGEEARIEGFRIMNQLHDSGVHATANFSDGSLKSQLKSAERLGAGYTIIIGDMEIKEKKAIIRDMNKGSQETIPLGDIMKYIHKIIPEEKRQKSIVDNSRRIIE
jgi:histidyl-tRNA synthetase